MWKILEQETIWAGNVRFSNDSEEYIFGIKGLNDYCFRGKIDIGDHKTPYDNYIICFCEDGDLLSQWREYARYGVSIGFDFTGGNSFLIENADKDGKVTGYDFIETSPQKVIYANKNNILDIIHGYRKQFEEDDGKLATNLYSIAPFIKNDCFKEESESRIVITLTGEDNARIVNYEDKNDYKKPYIRVKYGSRKKSVCDTVVLKCGRELNKMLKDVFKGKIGNDGNDIEVIAAGKGQDENDCIIIGDGDNQEEVMQSVEKGLGIIRKDLIVGFNNGKYNKEYYEKLTDRIKGIKIWARGHWPIRRLVVGPSENKKIIKESIEHYKNNRYWLKYIDVEVSKI
jgi:hypothetical protein